MSIDIGVLKSLQKAAANANTKAVQPIADEDKIDFDFSSLDQTLAQDWETGARETLIKMLQETAKINPDTNGLDVDWTFKVAPGRGKLHVNAMRAVLGRAKKKAGKKKAVEKAKLLVVDIKQTPTHDAVTLVRTKSTSRVAKSVYDDLIDLVSAESEQK